jgi:hypothetical protein
MSRPAKNVEFLALLKELSGHGTVASFARACGKKTPNMSNCLSGAITPQKKFLRSCVTHLYEWPVAIVMEVDKIPSSLNSLPTAAGIYVIYDSGGQVLYIGKATSIRAEVRQTLGRNIPVGIRLGPSLKKKKHKIGNLATHLSLYQIDSPRLRHNIESLMLRVFANQTHNSNIGRPR